MRDPAGEIVVGIERLNAAYRDLPCRWAARSIAEASTFRSAAVGL